MINTTTDFIIPAAYALTGDIPGSLVVRGDISYENIEWNTGIVTTTLPTKDEVLNKAQELYNNEAVTRLRVHRNRLMANSDWTQGADSPLSTSKKNEWATYRQALRDLPANSSPTLDGPFIKDVVWPTEPS
tara:strand:- start:564 stop:956 length:393 start_codon:yes stop_codon:yes gene_type:complete